MSSETHSQLADFIWKICNLLRGPYKRNEYRKVILPLTVLRRFDCILAPTKKQVLAEYALIKDKPENLIRHKLQHITGRPFYNLAELDFEKLLADPNNVAQHLIGYINGFSPNIRTIMEKFGFEAQIVRMAEKKRLYEVIKAFARVDLSEERVDNIQMGYIFEELIRVGAEQSNEEAGEHFTPREVIKLMVNLLLAPEKDLAKSHVVKTIFDPACGTGGMLSVADNYIRDLNSEAAPYLFGQDLNDEAWAVCKSDMLIKGEDADNIILDDSFTDDGFKGQKFDYMLANPPFGVEWKQQQETIEKEHRTLGFDGRFGAGLPRINDGALLFLQHMISKMRPPHEGGSRIAIVFNGSPLFTGEAGGGESEIRRWIIENDWLEAIVALPEQLFYNTGISTYIWVLTNHKEDFRKGTVQLIDARNFWVKMEKSLGNKRRRIGDPSDPKSKKDPDYIGEITKIYGNAKHEGEFTFKIDGKEKALIVSKIFKNEDFCFHKITVERPLQLNFQASAQRIARIETESAFQKLADSNKKEEQQRLIEVETGMQRQQAIRDFLEYIRESTNEQLYCDRQKFVLELKALERAHGIRLEASELKAVMNALSERDENATICRDRSGRPEPDPELRDTESVPRTERIEDYFAREVIPHVPDAWIDESKTKIGYEIPLSRHFYRYEPPRPLEEIESEIKTLEGEILDLLREVTA